MALALTQGLYPLLLVLAATAGMVRGNLTLLRATAVTDRRGTTQYGSLSGTLAAPVTIASAVSPFAGAALAGPLGGYLGLFSVLAVISVAAAALAVGSMPR